MSILELNRAAENAYTEWTRTHRSLLESAEVVSGKTGLPSKKILAQVAKLYPELTDAVAIFS